MQVYSKSVCKVIEDQFNIGFIHYACLKDEECKNARK